MQVNSSLKIMSQADRVVKKAFGTLVIISQGNEYISWDIIVVQDRLWAIVFSFGHIAKGCHRMMPDSAMTTLTVTVW